MGEIVAAYSDGGVIASNPSTEGGSWAWCHVDADNVIVDSASGILKPTPKWTSITNNYSELVAAMRCLEALPPGWSGTFCCDSQITIGRIFKGWSMVGIPDVHVRRMGMIMRRLGTVEPVLIAGHPTKAQLQQGFGSTGLPVSAFNVWCDNECNRVQQEYRTHMLSKQADGEVLGRMFGGAGVASQSATRASTMPQEARNIPDEWFTT